MTEDDDDLHELDLSAWEPPAPPAGLADAVVARMHAASPVTLEAEPRASRRWWIAGIAGGALAAGAVAALIFVGGSKRAAPGHGSISAGRAQHLDLDTASAELDAGAEVTWRRDGGQLAIEQQRGAATWRVGDDGLRIDAKVASIEAAGASLRVEVRMQSSDARVIGASAAVAAAISLATIVVYEGHVKVTSGGQTVNVEPGATVEVHPGQPPGPPPPVVAAEDKLGDLQRQIAELEAQVQSLQGKPAVAAPTVDPTSDVFHALRPAIVACAAASGMTGTINTGFKVLADGSIDGLIDVSIKADHAGDSDISPCITKAIGHIVFPKRAASYSFAFPITAPVPTGPCDEVSCVLNNYEGACCQQIKHAPVSAATGLTRTQISWAISYVKDRVTACGDKHPAKGIVKVHVRVRPDGAVTNVDVSQTPDAALGACVAEVIQSAKFPKTDDGGSFSYPFVFDGAPKTYDFTAKCDADALSDKGAQEEAIGQHAAALMQFDKAYACKPSERVARLGLMSACNSGNVTTARKWYARNSSPSRDQLTQVCVRAGIRPEQLQSAATSGFVTIEAKPQAKILIDGKDTGRFTPGTFELTPGKHKVTFLVGDDKYSFLVVVKSGATVELTKDFQ